jgi:beta-lactamase class A
MLAAAALPAGAAAQPGAGAPADPALQAALRDYAALPDETNLLVEAEAPAGAWRLAHQPDRPVFVGSCFKTFVLAAWLQEVEAGRRRLAEQVAIDDEIRALVSPVFDHLSGSTTARSVLEAMITHSDNTATDAAMRVIGVDRVRAVVERAGLRATRIPASTRRMFTAMAGAPPGADLGWVGVQRALEQPVGPLRPPLNPYETSVSTAVDLVGWYQRALAGTYFQRPESLTEFRRVQAMGDVIALVVPPGIAAYAKGGSIFWQDSNAVAVAGQMVVCGRPATFCFTLAWSGPEAGTAARLDAFKDAVAAVLRRTAELLG